MSLQYMLTAPLSETWVMNFKSKGRRKFIHFVNNANDTFTDSKIIQSRSWFESCQNVRDAIAF